MVVTFVDIFVNISFHHAFLLSLCRIYRMKQDVGNTVYTVLQHCSIIIVNTFSPLLNFPLRNNHTLCFCFSFRSYYKMTWKEKCCKQVELVSNSQEVMGYKHYQKMLLHVIGIFFGDSMPTYKKKWRTVRSGKYDRNNVITRHPCLTLFCPFFLSCWSIRLFFQVLFIFLKRGYARFGGHNNISQKMTWADDTW